jgi:dienelactone hydrolase
MRFAIMLICVFGAPLSAAEKGPWDLDELRKPPKVEWVDKEGPVRRLYYVSEPFGGKPTRVFAWYAEPVKTKSKMPAMVLVHGGGGTAFKEWAEMWAKRGYVAIAMDLAGCGPDKRRLADGGPGQGDEVKFPPAKTDLKEMWTYHAVAAVIRANSLLRSLGNVDPERIGITGISWGGYLTCIVAGLDDRFKAAVPVYGCGFLHENSVWLDRFAKLPKEWRDEWIENFDPSSHVKNAKMPILFVNGANDFAYPLDSYQKTYRLVKERNLCVTVNMPHGHSQGWAPIEIGLFVDQHVAKGKPLFRFAEHGYQVRNLKEDPIVVVPITAPWSIKAVRLHWTSDLKEPWQKRKWQTNDAGVAVGNFTDLWSVKLPKERPIVWFLTATDERKATVSSEHVVVEK